jgi:hypothetical protein
MPEAAKNRRWFLNFFLRFEKKCKLTDSHLTSAEKSVIIIVEKLFPKGDCVS